MWFYPTKLEDMKEGNSSSYRNGRINFGLRFLDHLKKTQSGPWICFASLQNFKLLILPSKSGSKASFQGHQTFAQSTNINNVANILIHLHSSPNRQTRKNQNLIIIKLIGSLSFKQNKKFQRKPFLFCVSQFLNNPQKIRHTVVIFSPSVAFKHINCVVSRQRYQYLLRQQRALNVASSSLLSPQILCDFFS